MISNEMIQTIWNIIHAILKYADDQLIELCNDNQNNATFKENSRETISLT